LKILFLWLVAAVSVFCVDIKIATYNVENLFDAKNDGSEYKDFVVGKSEWNEKKASAKFKAVSAKIKELNADIIALQEIENEAILKELMKEAGYKYFVFSKGKNAPIGLGLLSKIKPVKSEKISIPNVKTRDVLKADFVSENINFSLFALHFPARKNPIKQRRAAFLTLKSAIDGGKSNIVLGDFNTPFDDKDGLLEDLALSKGLENLWRTVPRDERYSHVGSEAIDQILLSRDIFKNAKDFKIRRDEKGEISDHFALSFTLSDNTAATASTTIDELYGRKVKLPKLVKNVVVTQRDRTGFTINDGDRGIYVYEPKSDVELGSKMDVVVTALSEYKGNLEISSYYVAKLIGKESIEKFMVGDIKNAKVGDVVRRISGKIRGNRLVGNFGEIKFYDRDKILKDKEEITLKGVRIKNYKNELQLAVER
jgi:hypothetical protein